jgi:nickel-dependent lactate racemase
MKTSLQQNIWDGFAPVEIDLPDNWNVEVFAPKGDEMRGLSRAEIKSKIDKPYGMKPISELARGKQKAAIVFDDITRGTPTQILAEIVLEELLEAGLKPEQIVFLCALGTHGCQNRADFEQKLGKEIVANYCIYNHNCYENCVELGVTKRGNKVKVNKELMSCDLKIGIGAMTPHVDNAFGGGYKIIFPGMAHIDTTEINHVMGIDYKKERALGFSEAMGRIENTGMRLEIEEMGRMIGEFFKIDCVYNSRLEILDVFAGDPVEEYYVGAGIAQKVYATPRVKNKDIVVANANAKACEAFIGILLALLGLKEDGGSVVLVNFTRRGQIPHYLIGMFGKALGGRQWGYTNVVDPRVKKIIYFTPYPDKTFEHSLAATVPFIVADTWDKVMKELGEYGEGAEVGLMTDSTISYYED